MEAVSVLFLAILSLQILAQKPILKLAITRHTSKLWAAAIAAKAFFTRWSSTIAKSRKPTTDDPLDWVLTSPPQKKSMRWDVIDNWNWEIVESRLSVGKNKISLIMYDSDFGIIFMPAKGGGIIELDNIFVEWHCSEISSDSFNYLRRNYQSLIRWLVGS